MQTRLLGVVTAETAQAIRTAYANQREAEAVRLKEESVAFKINAKVSQLKKLWDNKRNK